MQEHVAADDAVLRVVAEHEAVDALEILVAVALRRVGRRELARHRLGLARRAIPGSGCVDSQLGTPRSLSASTRASVARNRGTPVGILAGAGSVLDAEPIGFELVVAAVLEEQHAEAGRAEIGERLRARHEDAEDRQAEVRLAPAACRPAPRDAR